LILAVNREFYEEFELDLTGTCNLQCPLCTRNYSHAEHTTVKSIRPLNEIKKQLDTFPNLKRTFLAGQVSEPTLHPEFLDYVKYLKSRNIHIEMFTNGSTHNEEFWSELADILDETDECHFTICGSTQELHEKYRIGSDLQKLLNNAKAFRKKGNDYLQFIRFEYNKDEWDENMISLRDEFTHSYLVDTEGVRRINDKIKDVPDGVKPLETRDSMIKWLFDNRDRFGGIDDEIQCKSLTNKKIFINQEGKLSACYIHYEFNPEHIFEGDVFNYKDILECKYEDCWQCSKKASYFIDKFGLDFVC
jgi:MoaA/NifB/PqqE/SkfB family radical SAM enzyme